MVSPEQKQIVLARFTVCPNKDCKSERSLMRTLVKKEVKAGRMEEGEVEAGWFMTSAAAFNPTKPPLIGSVVQVGTGVIDICLDCGTVYALVVAKSEQTITPAPMPGMQSFQPPHIPGFSNPM